MHTCPLLTRLKYHSLFLIGLAQHPRFSSMGGRPVCSLKVKEKSEGMCRLNGLGINSQMALLLSVVYKSYTCKNGTESSEEGHNV